MKIGSCLRSSGRSAVLVLAAAVCAGVVGGCAGTRSGGSGAAVCMTDIPADLAVSGPVVGSVHATGWQVYTCAPDAEGKLAWKLKAPDATFDGDFKGTHYAGPKWEASDGSVVGASKVAEHPAAAADAVAWLLLKATAHEGMGKLSEVSYIQRLHTTGGKAPAVGAAKAGDEVRVPYMADYVFYGVGAERK